MSRLRLAKSRWLNGARKFSRSLIGRLSPPDAVWRRKKKAGWRRAR